MNERLNQLMLMLDEDPNDVFILYAIGLERYKLAQTDAAIAQLMDLVSIHENYVPAYFKLGQWFAELNLFEEAKNHLEIALKYARIDNDNKAIQEINELLFFIEDEIE